MEEPGPRRRPRRPLIIERPDLQSPAQRLLSGLLTAFFWALWVSIWLPVMGLIGWWVGLSSAFEQMVVLDGWRDVVDGARRYGIGIAALCSVLIAWATYNRVRFQGAERRSDVQPVGLTSQARRARVDPGELLLWQEARCLRVMHDRRGRIESVRAFGLRGPQPRSAPVTVPLRVRAMASGNGDGDGRPATGQPPGQAQERTEVAALETLR